MENNKYKFELCMEDLYLKAVQAYKETEEGKIINKKVIESEKKLQERFSRDDFAYLIKNTASIQIKMEQEGKFLYRQGFKDAIYVLKLMEIL